MRATTNFEAASTTSRPIRNLPIRTDRAQRFGTVRLASLARQRTALLAAGCHGSLDRPETREVAMEASAKLRDVLSEMHDLLMARGGEWSDGTSIYILTPDAEAMARAGGKWTTIARFDADDVRSNTLRTFRAARQVADAKGVA